MKQTSVALTLVLSFAAACAAAGCSNTSSSGPVAKSPAASASANVVPREVLGAHDRVASNPGRPVLNVYAATESAQLSPAVAGIPERVYVPDNITGTIDVIDPATYGIVGHFRVGRSPQHISPSWDLTRLYVSNTAGNSLTIIDPRTSKPTGSIAIADPYNLYFTPDGTKAIIVAERERRLDFRSARSWDLIKSVPVPWRGVDHLDFSADGSYLIVSAEFSGEVVRVDVRSMAVTGFFSAGGSPVDVKLAPDGSVFYVANQGRNGVSVVDPVHMREVSFILTGLGAHGLYVSRDAKSLYVSNRRDGSVSVVDFATRRVTATWRVGGSPDMIQLSPDGRQLWVSNRYDASVSVVDTENGRLIRVIRVGAGPHGLSYFPQPGRFSLGHNGVYR